MRTAAGQNRFTRVTEESAGERSRWTIERRPGGWTWADAALAGLFLVILVGEIVPNPDMTPHVPLVALAVVIAVAMAWRTARAGTVAVVVAAAQLVQCVVATGPFSPQLSVVPLLIVLYSAASRTRGRNAIVVGAATLALTVAAWLATEEGDGEDFWPWMLWAGAWAAGTFVRRRGDLAAHHAERAALLEIEAAESAQRERDRIARELHDVVAHSVSVMVVQAGAERLRLGPDAGRTGTALEAIEESGRLALAELRAMLGVLRDQPADEALAPLPGLAAVPALVARVRDAGLPVELVIDLPAPEIEYGAAGLAAYRIVQEALTNVVRHAGPVPTRVAVECAIDHLVVTVHDEGTGSSAEGPGLGRGRGLVGMRERTDRPRGQLRGRAGPYGGFCVRATLPFAHTTVTR